MTVMTSTITSKTLPFVLWACLAWPTISAGESTQIGELLDKIKRLPPNDNDINAVNVLNCLQDCTWKLLIREYSDHDYRRLTDQALVTRSIFRGGLGASKDLSEIKENHTLFMQHYDNWMKTDSYRQCLINTGSLAAEPMPADDPTHPCRRRCQCNAVYHYVSNFKHRVGDVQKIALKFDYLDEVWVLTSEYHRDFERYEIAKHIYPADMELLKAYFSLCE
ncbi:uncharacterized protein LOC100898581 [Galendromus occidentalis]|uniref:Uncharacterized protein LOC100898581 n=1 Tax=Galendromus occidentalis TaxID=34638 RepID=A0AAJ6QLU9_9ACAR|nr:uncharacterized protein LOC100898581 [Galendromus occidentalis]